MNLSRYRILIFLGLSVLLHGLVLLYSPPQGSLSSPVSSDIQALRIEMMTVPAAVSPPQTVEDQPQPRSEPLPAATPPLTPAEISEAPPKKKAATRPQPLPEPEPQPAPQEPPRETSVAAQPEAAVEAAMAADRQAEPAQAHEAPAPQSLTALPATLEPRRDLADIDALRQAYLSALPPLIRPHQRYPRAAQRSGREGTVIVRFVLERDGRLRETSIVQSSGDALLDQAAASAIERVPRFPAFPAELPEESLPIELPVRFDRSMR